MPRLQRFGRIAAAVVTTAVLIPAAACDGPLQPLAIQQKSPESTLVFTGKGSAVTVEFINETGRANVDEFPEPPLTIRRKEGAACEVDGGIWVRRSAHLSKDEKVLMLQEYSGSSDSLVFYDTANCKELRRLDISSARWELSGDQLLIGKSCSGQAVSTCNRVERFEFDQSCLPKRTTGNR